jgi:hypothetical protein
MIAPAAAPTTPPGVSAITASSTILRSDPSIRLFDRKKLPAMCVKFAAAYPFTVHELGTFASVSKSSFRTYIRLLLLTAE